MGTVIKKRIRIYVPSSDNSKPQLVFPPNFATSVSLSTPLLWASFPNTLFYEWQLSEQSSVSSIYDGGFSIERVTFPTSLMMNRIYFWKVRAYGVNWISDWSPTWTFSTFPVVTVEESNEYNGFLMNPNPVIDNLYLSFPIVEMTAEIEIYNAIGVSVLRAQNLSKDVQLSVQHLPNGLYTVKYSTAKGVYSKQFVKIQ